jgi:hypothetical protein
MSNPTGKGGFTRGNPDGPGRPRRAVERQYPDATVRCVPLTGFAPDRLSETIWASLKRTRRLPLQKTKTPPSRALDGGV